LNQAVTAAKTKRLEQEALYQQLTSIQSDPANLDSFPAVLSNQFIQQQRAELSTLMREEAQLAQTFGPANQRLIAVRSAIQTTKAKLQSQIENVVSAVRTEYETAKAQEASLTRALQTQTQEALAMNKASIQFGVLKRDAESARQVYQTLLQRTKETGI